MSSSDRRSWAQRGLSEAGREGRLRAVGSSSALLRSESHFHVMGAVHTLEGSGEQPEPDFSKYTSQAKQLLGLELRFLMGGWASPWIPYLWAVFHTILLQCGAGANARCLDFGKEPTDFYSLLNTCWITGKSSRAHVKLHKDGASREVCWSPWLTSLVF
jgi:hypothetical protein